jgi:hypothetical protein
MCRFARLASWSINATSLRVAATSLSSISRNPGPPSPTPTPARRRSSINGQWAMALRLRGTAPDAPDQIRRADPITCRLSCRPPLNPTTCRERGARQLIRTVRAPLGGMVGDHTPTAILSIVCTMQ